MTFSMCVCVCVIRVFFFLPAKGKYKQTAESKINYRLDSWAILKPYYCC